MKLTYSEKLAKIKQDELGKRARLKDRERLRRERIERKELEKRERANLRIKTKEEKMRAKVKQPKLKKLKDELQRITNRVVRTMTNICFTCDKPLEFKDRQAGHHFSRGASSAARFEWDNLRTQCVTCNLHLSGNQVEFAYRLRREIGDERYEDLYRRAHTIRKWTREDLMQLIEARKEAFKHLL